MDLSTIVNILILETKRCSYAIAHKKFLKAEYQLQSYFSIQNYEHTYLVVENLISPLLIFMKCERYYNQLSFVGTIIKDKGLGDTYNEAMHDFNTLIEFFNLIKLSDESPIIKRKANYLSGFFDSLCAVVSFYL